MPLVIDLTPEEESRLRTHARERGVEPADCVRQLLKEGLQRLEAGRPGEGTAALFARWEAEDAAEDPDEIAARIREWEELKSHLNANRAAAGEAPLFE